MSKVDTNFPINVRLPKSILNKTVAKENMVCSGKKEELSRSLDPRNKSEEDSRSDEEDNL